MAISNTLRNLAMQALAFCILMAHLAALLFSCEEKSVLPTLDDIPQYSTSVYTEINGNKPFFTKSEIVKEPFKKFSKLDELGRAGAAIACLSREIMPTEEREPLFSANPSGMYRDGKSNNHKYKFIDNGYLYNRTHLIGFQLCGENANLDNLITATSYMNVSGMLPFENSVADYLKRSGGHVMYRVTPMYREYDLVARGVLMEAYSVEDEGASICFCVFIYNVQRGVIIDYYSGDNNIDTRYASPSDFERAPTYVLNTNSKKYHLPECHYAKSTKEEYIEYYTGGLYEFESVYASQYSPCLSCNPHKNK